MAANPNWFCANDKEETAIKKHSRFLLAAILAAADAAVTLNNTDYPGVKVPDTNTDLSVLADGDARYYEKYRA